MPLSLITAPTTEWIEVSDARAFLRETNEEQDPTINSFIKAASQYVERVTNRQLLTATWELWRDAFPAWCIDIPKPPLVSVVSIKYLDTAGVEQTWAADQYRTSMPAGPDADRGRITPAYSVTFPSTYDVMDAVKIRFTAGYGTAGKHLPPALVEAMQLLLANWYENREATVVGIGMVTAKIPYGVDQLILPFKRRALAAV